MKFWDSSAIIPLCVNSAQTRPLRRILEADHEMVVWWATPVECCSAFARTLREGLLNAKDEGRARQLLFTLSEVWAEVLPSNDLRQNACRILMLHSPRAADSLQLAAAMTWAGQNIPQHHFISLDQRLRQAAYREGFQVLPE